MNSCQSVHVVVAGGGPIGLTFAACLVDHARLATPPAHIRITIFDHRWTKERPIQWKKEQEKSSRRWQVVTLQSNVWSILPFSLQEALFQPGMYCEVWPHGPDSPQNQGFPRNIHVRTIEDRLLELVQHPAFAGFVTLRPQPFGPAAAHRLFDEQPFHFVVFCDSGRKTVCEDVAPGMFGSISPDNGINQETALSAYFECDKASGPETYSSATAVLLSAAQTRFLVNPLGSTCGFLNMRLLPSEIQECLGWQQSQSTARRCLQNKRCIMQRDSLGFFRCSTHNLTFKPPTRPLAHLLDGLLLYGIPLAAVRLFTCFQNPSRRRPVVQAELTNFTFKAPTVCNLVHPWGFLLDDAATALHVGVGGGINSGLKAAISLAKVLSSTLGGRFEPAALASHVDLMSELQFTEGKMNAALLAQLQSADSVTSAWEIVKRAPASREKVLSEVDHLHRCWESKCPLQLPSVEALVASISDSIKPETWQVLADTAPWPDVTVVGYKAPFEYAASSVKITNQHQHNHSAEELEAAPARAASPIRTTQQHSPAPKELKAEPACAASPMRTNRQDNPSSQEPEVLPARAPSPVETTRQHSHSTQKPEVQTTHQHSHSTQKPEEPEAPTPHASSPAETAHQKNPSTQQLGIEAFRAQSQPAAPLDPPPEWNNLNVKQEVTHSTWIMYLSWNASGHQVATGGHDSKLRIVDAASGNVQAEMLHGGWPAAVSWKPSGEQLALSGPDGGVRILDGATGTQVVEFPRWGWTKALCWSPAGLHIATGGDDGKLRIVDVTTCNVHMEIPVEGWTLAVAWSACGGMLATGGADGKLRVVDVTSGSVQAELPHAGRVRSVAWSPCSKHVAVGGADGSVWFVDAVAGTIALEVVHGGQPRATAWSPSGRGFASAGADGKLRFLSISSMEVQTDAPHNGQTRALVWSPSGDQLATAGDDGKIRVMDAGTWTLALEVAVANRNKVDGIRPAVGGRLRALSWSPSGQLLAAGGDDGRVYIVDSTSGNVRLEFPKAGRLRALAWSPSEQQLAAGGDDGKLRLLEPGGENTVADTHVSPTTSSTSSTVANQGTDQNANQVLAPPNQLGRSTLLVGAGRQVLESHKPIP